MYGAHGTYAVLQWLLLIGFSMPIIVYYLGKRFTFFKWVHVPVLISGFSSWSPVGLGYALPGFYVALGFNGWIKRRYEGWWLRYAYVLSAGSMIGIALSGIIMFFAVQWVDQSSKVLWWGNTVSFAGADGAGSPLLPL